MDSPLISVLLPVHEFTPYTVVAAQSILQQTHSNIELLIIGHDDINELLKKLPTDTRIRGIARCDDGIVGALNTGLQHCNGEYIARMDSDDESLPQRLAQQLTIASTMAKQLGQHPLLGAKIEFFSDEHPIEQGNRRYEQWLNSITTPLNIEHSCFIESPLPHPTFFAHRSVWNSIGCYRNKAWPEDYDFLLRAWLLGIPMCKPENMLLRWREHPDRLTYQNKRYSRQAFINVKAWALAHSNLLGHDKTRNVWICGTGRNARMWHDALASQGIKVIGFVELNHNKQKTQKRHLPVIDYDTLQEVWSNELVITAITHAQARAKLIALFSRWNKIQGRGYLLGG